jgi:hypothetical protein
MVSLVLLLRLLLRRLRLLRLRLLLRRLRLLRLRLLLVRLLLRVSLLLRVVGNGHGKSGEKLGNAGVGVALTALAASMLAGMGAAVRKMRH